MKRQSSQRKKIFAKPTDKRINLQNTQTGHVAQLKNKTKQNRASLVAQW